jgi:hypothetical protein
VSFILRIFFSGLIAFVPGDDGKEVTVLLLRSGHVHSAQEAAIPEHKPVLFARGGGCSGDCATQNATTAAFFYPDAASQSAAADALRHAVQGGSVWQLAGADLSFGIPDDGVTLARAESIGRKSVPDSATELSDFGWIPRLEAIDPTAGDVDPAVLSEHPPEDLIVARLRLKSGRFSTYSVVQVNGKAIPVDFRPLLDNGDRRYMRAVANWVRVDVQVPGDSLEIVETNFSTGATRTMSLRPEQGLLDVAVLNISQPIRSGGDVTPQPGAHFERFWELTENPPAYDERPIPQLPRTKTRQTDLVVLRSNAAGRSSALLDDLLLSPDKGPYDQILCPMTQVP